MIRGKKGKEGGEKNCKGKERERERERENARAVVITGSLLEDRWKNLQGNSIISVSGRFELQVSDTRRAFQCEFGSNRCRHAGVATVAARRFQWDGWRGWVVLQMTGLRERYAYRVPVEAFEICIAPSRREEEKEEEEEEGCISLRDLRTLRNVALERCLSVEMWFDSRSKLCYISGCLLEIQPPSSGRKELFSTKENSMDVLKGKFYAAFSLRLLSINWVFFLRLIFE